MENETIKNNLDETMKLPEDFDWKIYLIKNVDLILAGIKSKDEAINHYLQWGINESRVYYEDDKINYFVYCGGKCGSTTLNTTLLKNNMKSIHFHSEEFSNLNHNKSNYKIINNNKNKNEKLYFIDSYRTPIERKMSSFFQNLKTEKLNWSHDDLVKEFNEKCIEKESNIIIHFEKGNADNISCLIKKISENIKIDEIHEKYIRVNMMSNDNLNILCTILDKNKESLGILSYKKNFYNYYEYYHSIDELFRHFNISETFTNFDFDKKYGMYQHENMVFIKIRFCDIDDWGKILSDIFGKEITMFSGNLTEKKKYFELYKEFTSNYKVSKSFIKEILKDEHFNAYNTIEERRKYIKYWMDRSY
jgi:hypothetical protein